MLANRIVDTSGLGNHLSADAGRPWSTSTPVNRQPQVTSDPRIASSTSLNMPHDAVIGQIDKELKELQDNPASEKTLPGKLRRRELPENMSDPFDGQSIGVMVPGEFEETEDDLWTHLAEIRNLQGDIARMHAQMERLGENDRFYGPEATGEEETVNVEDEAKAAKAAEFAKLSDRFNVRKDAIDAIMQKLQTLSKSINDFHASRAHIFRSLSSQIPSGDEKNTGKPGTVSGRTEDDPGMSILSSRVLTGDEILKDSPESISRVLTDRQTSIE